MESRIERTREGRRTGNDGMLAAPPDTLDVDGVGQVPNLLLGRDGVVIRRVHDTGVLRRPEKKYQQMTSIDMADWREPTLNWKRGGCVQELDRQLLLLNQHKTKIRGGGTHEHIKSSKLLNGALDGSLDLSLLAHIALDRPSLRLGELGSDDLGSLLNGSPVRSAETPPQSARAREARDVRRKDERRTG